MSVVLSGTDGVTWVSDPTTGVRDIYHGLRGRGTPGTQVSTCPSRTPDPGTVVHSPGTDLGSPLYTGPKRRKGEQVGVTHYVLWETRGSVCGREGVGCLQDGYGVDGGVGSRAHGTPTEVPVRLDSGLKGLVRDRGPLGEGSAGVVSYIECDADGGSVTPQQTVRTGRPTTPKLRRAQTNALLPVREGPWTDEGTLSAPASPVSRLEPSL